MQENQRLWNRDFTIITIGSIISMFGNAVAGIAIGLLILDSTNSVFIFTLTMVLYNLPKVIMPSISGPFLDKFSRKRTLYTLDFISAFLFTAFTLMDVYGHYNFLLILVMCTLVGSIDSVYIVAYDSLYPLLITKNNYNKAYSIANMIKAVAQFIVPVAVIVYKTIGIAPLFGFNAITFLFAAILETIVKVNETHVDKLGFKYNIKAYKEDFKEGVHYLKSNKGLQYITMFYIVFMFAFYVGGNMMLPYFKNTEGLGLWMYIVVGACIIIGRLVGGSIHYGTRLPAAKKFSVAMIAYIVMACLEGSYMFLNVRVMMIFMFISGMLFTTTFNIRMSGTQHYVQNDMRARFNGTFQTLTVLGGSTGALVAGALAEFIEIPYIVSGAFILLFIATFAIMLRHKEAVKEIYNVEL